MRYSLSCSPFSIDTVRIGSRVGYRWCCNHRGVPKQFYYFETNWLNDAPEIGSEEHKKYRKVVEKRTKKSLGPFVGLYQPPNTKDEFEELVINYIRSNQHARAWGEGGEFFLVTFRSNLGYFRFRFDLIRGRRQINVLFFFQFSQIIQINLCVSSAIRKRQSLLSDSFLIFIVA